MPNSSVNPYRSQELPFFTGSQVCDRCLNTGLWQLPNGEISVCSNITVGHVHAEPNAASQLLQKAVSHLADRKTFVNAQAFEIARHLTRFNTTEPCTRQDLVDSFFSYVHGGALNKIRKFQAAVEELRRVWLLPVGSRKNPPAGYWIITDIDDFAEWVERSKSAPITQLSTIHRVARRNFPIYAEQIELDFWTDMHASEGVRDVG